MAIVTGFVTVYVIAADAAEARKIGHGLVAARLAACANILGDVQSIFRWEGKLEEAAEVAVLLKTRKSLVPLLSEWVKANHSYRCPAIVAWPIEAGNPDYLAWIEAETRAPD